MGGELSNFYKVIPWAIDWLLTLYVFAFILRGVFSMIYADFYNPISQFIFKITEPLISLVRIFIPAFKQFDPTCWFLAWLLNSFKLIVISALAGMVAPLLTVSYFSALEIIELLIKIYIWSIFILAVSSWFISAAETQSHAFLSLLYSLTHPMLQLFRRWIPPAGVIDFSPLLALLVLFLLSQIVYKLRFIY